jgi:hypothetical protein
VQFDELFGDGKTQPQALPAIDSALRLANRFEYEREKLRRDSGAGVRDRNLDLAIRAMQ